MITKVNNGISTLKNLFLEVLIDQTSKISNVADGSVVNAIAFGVGKVHRRQSRILPLWKHSYSPNMPQVIILTSRQLCLV